MIDSTALDLPCGTISLLPLFLSTVINLRHNLSFIIDVNQVFMCALLIEAQNTLKKKIKYVKRHRYTVIFPVCRLHHRDMELQRHGISLSYVIIRIDYNYTIMESI